MKKMSVFRVWILENDVRVLKRRFYKKSKKLKFTDALKKNGFFYNRHKRAWDVGSYFEVDIYGVILNKKSGEYTLFDRNYFVREKPDYSDIFKALEKNDKYAIFRLKNKNGSLENRVSIETRVGVWKKSYNRKGAEVELLENTKALIDKIEDDIAKEHFVEKNHFKSERLKRLISDSKSDFEEEQRKLNEGEEVV